MVGQPQQRSVKEHQHKTAAAETRRTTARALSPLIAGSFLVLLLALATIPGEAEAQSGRIISNGVVQIGVRAAGDLNYAGGTPSSGTGTTTVGLRYVPTNAEATAAGCTCEGWGASYNGTTAGYANSAGGGVVGIIPEWFNTTSSTAVSVVRIGNIRVTQDYHPSNNDNAYEVKVTIENIGPVEITDVRYRRVMDWDIEPTAFREHVTIHGGTPTATALLFSSNDGFGSASPLGARSNIGYVGPPTGANFADAGPSDHGALFDFGFGSLVPTATKSFTLWYGAAPSEAAALDALGSVGAEVYSLGQPSSANGASLGTPNTFFFGFGGVGGTPARAIPLTTATYAPANAAGWHKENVAVELTCTVTNSTCNATYYRLGTSGAYSIYTAPFAVATEAVNTLQFYSSSETGTVESTQSRTIRLDRTAPGINATRTAANAYGWNTGTVVVSFTCTDSLSGTSAIPSQTLATQGADQSATGTCTDVAGNSASRTVSDIHIDRSVPVATATWAPAPVAPCAPAGGAILQDNFDRENGGFDAIRHTAFANWTVTRGSVDIYRAGSHGLSVDLDGSSSAAGRLESHSFTLAPGCWLLQFALSQNGAGPNTMTVAVGSLFNESVTRSGSTPFETFARRVDVPAETTTTLVFNHAGGDNFGLVIDEVLLTPLPGWSRTPVTVTYACTDDVSGLVSAAIEPVVFPTDGANQSVSRQCTDKAGLVGGYTVGSIHIDQTAPVLTSTRTPANANGWNAGDVTVSWACSDATSGVGAAPSPSSVLFTAELMGHISSATCTDVAGNPAASSVTVHIDRTAPTASIASSCATPGNAPWCRSASVPYWGNASDTVLVAESSGRIACTDSTPVRFYLHTGHSGGCAGYDGSRADLPGGFDSGQCCVNNNITTMRLAAGYSVVLYDDAHYGGATRTFVGPYVLLCCDFNDLTSSFRLYKPTLESAACTVADVSAACTGSLGDGVHALGLTATDLAGHTTARNASLSIDSVAPAFAAYDDLTLPADAFGGATVNYGLPEVDDNGSGIGTLACSPLAGSFFAIGNTSVTCDATDVAGNAATMSFMVTITPAALDSIVVSGLDTMVAGTSWTFQLAGFDQHGNAAPLAQDQLNRTMPTTVGDHTVSYSEQDVTGSHTVEVVADILASITLTGHDRLVAGTSWNYALAGFDQYGNSVPLGAPHLNVTAPTAIGMFTRSYSEQGVTGSKTIESVHDRLVRIRVTGLDTLQAGQTAEYSLAGFDRHNNPVPLARLTTNFTAPTAPGATVVRYTEQGVTGTRNVQVTAAALHHIVVTGITSVVAGQTYTYGLGGFDQYENPVPLAQNSTAFTAPTSAGNATVSYTESGITGSKVVSVVAEALASIVVTGPASLVAGQTAEYATDGFDQYGNAVPLSPPTMDFTAPTAVGTYVVSRTVDNVTGSMDVEVVADALASITLSGPPTVVAGSSTEYALAGFDQHGNAVPLAQESTTFDAPTNAGSAFVTYTEGAISGSLAVDVVAAGLARIDVSGPDSVVAGTTNEFGIAGFDTHGNPVVLASTTFDHVAPTMVGPTTAAYTEQGITGSRPVNVVADALASILVSGPATLVAGTSDEYVLAGFDQYANSVPLAQASLSFTAPTFAGPATVSYTESGVTGALGVTVVADELASITLSGPATLVAGTAGDYALAGFDQYGNAVGLAQASIVYTAPDFAGSYTVAYTEQEITGTQLVEVVHAPLWRIDVAGPTVLVAGTGGEYAIAGFDQFDNPVSLAQATLAYTAPTLVGIYDAVYTEAGVTGSQAVEVIADVLATIAVSGPAEIVAGTSETYLLAGFDQYGNAVVLAATETTFTAATLVGTATVSYTEGGIEGTLDVTIIPDALASITLAGPATMVANTTASFDLAGFDQYGNSVTLAEAQLSYTAPTLVGSYAASYSEAGITGSAPVEVVADVLASILVSGPSPIYAGYDRTYELAGFDRYTNAVPLAENATVFAAPDLPGAYVVMYAEDGITGSLAVQVILPPVHHVTVTPANATINVNRTLQLRADAYDDNGRRIVYAPFAWSTSNGTVNATGAFRMDRPGLVSVRAASDGVAGLAGVEVSDLLLVNVTMRKMDIDPLGHALRGTVLVRYLDGAPVAGANVTVTLSHAKGVLVVEDARANGTTNATGEYRFSMVPLFAAPGDYTATAFATWSGNAGEGETTFTASPISTAVQARIAPAEALVVTPQEASQ